MDNKSLRDIIQRISSLKYKYLGSFPANMMPLQLPINTFLIVNTEPSGEKGLHWVMFANKSGKIYYADSLGLPLSRYKFINQGLRYKNVKRMVYSKLQNMSICGLYCIYFAWILFSDNTLPTHFNDFNLMQFIYKYL